MGSVTAVLIVKPPPMPGSRFTGPNPHRPPSPTHPDQTATPAGMAIGTSHPLRFNSSPSLSGVRSRPGTRPAGAAYAFSMASFTARHEYVAYQADSAAVICSASLAAVSAAAQIGGEDLTHRA